MDHDLITKLTGQVIAQMRQRTIPLGISNRHVHLSAKDYQSLFPGQTLKIKSPWSARAICGRADRFLNRSKRSVENVRILGPLRGQTQVKSRTPMRANWPDGATPPVR